MSEQSQKLRLIKEDVLELWAQKEVKIGTLIVLLLSSYFMNAFYWWLDEIDTYMQLAYYRQQSSKLAGYCVAPSYEEQKEKIRLCSNVAHLIPEIFCIRK